jgi:hypothetical protein
MHETRARNTASRYLYDASLLLLGRFTTEKPVTIAMNYKCQLWLLGEGRAFGTPGPNAVRHLSRFDISIEQGPVVWKMTFRPHDGPHRDEGKFWKVDIKTRFHSINNTFLDLQAAVAAGPPQVLSYPVKSLSDQLRH